MIIRREKNNIIKYNVLNDYGIFGIILLSILLIAMYVGGKMFAITILSIFLIITCLIVFVLTLRTFILVDKKNKTITSKKDIIHFKDVKKISVTLDRNISEVSAWHMVITLKDNTSLTLLKETNHKSLVKNCERISNEIGLR